MVDLYLCDSDSDPFSASLFSPGSGEVTVAAPVSGWSCTERGKSSYWRKVQFYHFQLWICLFQTLENRSKFSRIIIDIRKYWSLIFRFIQTKMSKDDSSMMIVRAPGHC